MKLTDPTPTVSMESLFPGYHCLTQHFPEIENPIHGLYDLQNIDAESLITSVNSSYQHPLLAEVLGFEILSVEASHAVDEESVPAEMLEFFSDEQWPELLVLFQPSVRRLKSRYELPAIMTEVCLEEFKIENIKPQSSPNQVLIFKTGNEVVSRYMSLEEASAFDDLLRGKNIETVSQSNEAAKASKDPLGVIVNFLIKWCQEGLVIDVGVPIPEGAEYAD